MRHDEPTTATTDHDPLASPEIVMFFLGPDGEPVPDGDLPDLPRPRTLAELYRDWRSLLDHEREHEEFHRHRPTDRKVQGIGKPGRTGYRDEIVVTLRSDPVRAVAEATRTDVFDPPIDRLDVDVTSLTTSRYELRWTAWLRVWPWQRRPATLRLYASPSLNVTVLSLLPVNPRSIARRRFLRIGLRTMNALRDRIDDRVGTRPHRAPATVA